MAGQDATILGLSASLRNARFGAGSETLTADIKGLQTRQALDEYYVSRRAFAWTILSVCGAASR